MKIDVLMADRLIPAHAGKTAALCRTGNTRPAHPRSRGENMETDPTQAERFGSSPLTRGKPPSNALLQCIMRLIPAHAGKTLLPPSRPWSLSAHPRSRGENSTTWAARLWRRGSSPLTRGKPATAPAPARSARLIPAHAGKTAALASAARIGPAHPRSRGENQVLRKAPARLGGSSPLTRGKLRRLASLQLPPRLIPAHAGKTWIAGSGAGAWSAHPRSRGENALMFFACAVVFGSSPLTRGKLLAVWDNVLYPRLIPAHAGKTSLLGSGARSSAAHPRSRGENVGGGFGEDLGGGSSPLTRGKRERSASPPSRPPAHPRSRGENSVHEARFHRALGSSPLTRGKRIPAPLGASGTRLIPAHAGKTTPTQCPE